MSILSRKIDSLCALGMFAYVNVDLGSQLQTSVRSLARVTVTEPDPTHTQPLLHFRSGCRRMGCRALQKPRCVLVNLPTC